MDTTITVEGLTKTVGQGDTTRRMLDDVAFAVSPGEIVVIGGPFGSGKSLLLSICAGLVQPDAGRIWLGGNEITALAASERTHVLRRLVGYARQPVELSPQLTVVDAVTRITELVSSPSPDAAGRARALLEELRLVERATEPIGQLSSAELQRLALARALASDPSLVLADEPTANLDTNDGARVVQLLEFLTKQHGRSVIAVTNDPRLESIADRVHWLENGQLQDSVSVREPTLAQFPTMAVRRHSAGWLVNTGVPMTGREPAGTLTTCTIHGIAYPSASRCPKCAEEGRVGRVNLPSEDEDVTADTPTDAQPSGGDSGAARQSVQLDQLPIGGESVQADTANQPGNNRQSQPDERAATAPPAAVPPASAVAPDAPVDPATGGQVLQSARTTLSLRLPPHTWGFLVQTHGPEPGRIVELGDESLSIGRDPRNALTIADDMVSRSHAQVQRDDEGRFVVTDCNSTNGTNINGQALDGPRALEDGDVITIGNTRLVFKCVSR